MLQVDITPIIVGYCEGSRACGTVSLFEYEGRKVLVDCGGPADGELIVRRLAEIHVQPDQITDLLITHGHIDHCGNMRMFPNATVYMNKHYRLPTGQYKEIGDELSICDGLAIKAMIGHSDRDLILIASHDNSKIIAAGDLFEDQNDTEQNSWITNSKHPEEHDRAREWIMKQAREIIPGHGASFRSPREYKRVFPDEKRKEDENGDGRN